VHLVTICLWRSTVTEAKKDGIANGVIQVIDTVVMPD
jgi:hypothetical protein